MGRRRAQSVALGAGLARRLSSIDAETLSEQATAKARACVLDYLACALESTRLPWSRQALEVANASSGGSACGAFSLVGQPHKVVLADAVFVNAVLGHGLVRDDMHLGSVSHLGAVIMPVVLGLAQRERVDGRRLVAAIAAGYEAGGRIGRMILDVEIAKIHRPTGVTGPFAAAAAGAKLLGLDTEGLANALAFAANMTAGFNQWAATGGSEMFFHAGLAARNGLTAAELARVGAQASANAIEGPAGLLAAFGKAAGAELEDAAGLEISSVFFKEVPACNYAQAPAQAARAIALRFGTAPEQIRAVTVRVARAAAEYPGCDAPGPFERALQAKMSIQYNVAAALSTASFEEGNYAPADNPRIAELARRVEIVVDAELTQAYPARQGAEVRVRTAGGDEWHERVADVEPADATLVRDRLVRAAGAALGERAAADMLAVLDRLESVADAGDLLPLTVPGERTFGAGAP